LHYNYAKSVKREEDLLVLHFYQIRQKMHRFMVS